MKIVRMQPLAQPKGSRAPRVALLILVLALAAVAALAAASTPVSHAGPAVESPQDVGVASGQVIYIPFLYTDGGSAPSLPYSPFGVQLFWRDLEPEPLQTEPATVGAQWLRLQLYWNLIEPQNTTPVNYNWPGGLEQQLIRLQNQGVNVILTLASNPSWAADTPDGPVYHLYDLVEFMQAVVGRYGAPPYDIKYWEIYNEPDHCVHFGDQPEAYVELLQAIYGPMKAADPEAQITFGGMAYDFFEPSGPFVRTFLDGVLANGGGGYFDVMNFHYYPAFAPDWAPYGIDILGKYNYLRDKLASYGVYKPFICTETSKWSDEGAGGSDELQSRYVTQVYARSMSGGLRVAIWWALVDVADQGTDTTGLIDTDLQPKPSYWAYRTLAQQLGTATFGRTWTEAETGAPLRDVEVYEFGPGEGATWPDGTARILVAWTNYEGAHTLVVPVSTLLQVDKYGGATQVHDGADGQVDGLIHLTIGPSPVYLRLPQ